jgi:hypothetical protein
MEPMNASPFACLPGHRGLPDPGPGLLLAGGRMHPFQPTTAPPAQLMTTALRTRVADARDSCRLSGDGDWPLGRIPPMAALPACRASVQLTDASQRRGPSHVPRKCGARPACLAPYCPFCRSPFLILHRRSVILIPMVVWACTPMHHLMIMARSVAPTGLPGRQLPLTPSGLLTPHRSMAR